jgi:hypothetical protein
VVICASQFQHPGICLLRVKVTVLFIFGEKIKLMSLKVLYPVMFENWNSKTNICPSDNLYSYINPATCSGY